MATGIPSYLTCPELDSTSRFVATVIDRLTRVGHDCWLSTKTIAELIGKELRTAQVALQRLSETGFVRVLRDRTKNSGQVIELLWRRGRASAVGCAEQAQWAAPRVDPPYNPPVEVSEDKLSIVVESARETTTTTESVPIQGSKSDERAIEASPAVREATDSAVALFGASVKADVAIACRRYGTDWVVRAIGDAKRYGARHWGYVDRCLRNWRERGGPPEDKATIPMVESVEDMASQMAKARAEYAARIGGGA